MDNQPLKCVLIRHGMNLHVINPDQIGVCCYNHQDPKKYTGYDIDPRDCRACIDQENNGIKSYRQGANERYGLEHDHQDPLVLDLLVNRTCNLACKICGPGSSSTWARLLDIKISEDYNLSYQKFLDQFEGRNLKRVQEINFSGGEPLLNNNIVKYLSLLEDRIDFSNCVLRFSTNGTVTASQRLWQDFFRSFKFVAMRFSLDDIGVGHEYQRWPSKWDDWVENWQEFLQELPHNVIPSLNRTVSVLNLNRLHLLDQWHKDYEITKFGDKIELIDHFAFGEFSLDHLPEGLKQHIRHKHGEQSRAWQYIKDRPAQKINKKLQNSILSMDKLNRTVCSDFDPELYKAVFS